MSLFLFCVTARDFFHLQQTMEQTMFFFFRTVDMKWLEQNTLNIGLQTKIVGFIATLTYHEKCLASSAPIQRTRRSPIRSITLQNSDRGCSWKCYTVRVRLCPGVQPHTLCYKKKDRKGLTDTFCGSQKVVKTLWFCDLFLFKRQCIYSS